jgi:hypothetical protein
MMTLSGNKLLAAFAALACAACLYSAPARAQCETPGSATSAMQSLVSDDISNINDWVNQEWNFIDEDLSNTAALEAVTRMEEFQSNILGWLNNWWNTRYLPAMKDMTKQWSAAQVEQTAHLGAIMDSSIQNETKLAKYEKQVEAFRRYAPSETTCDVDSIMATGATKAQKMSVSLSRSFATDASGIGLNSASKPAGSGEAAQRRADYETYVTYFCDPDRGDQGCAAPGSMAGMNTDLPALLFGNKQSIDMSNPDARVMAEGALRTLLQPEAPDVIPTGVVLSAAGQEELLIRRARAARINTTYNAVAQLLGQHVEGSGVDSQTLRTATGVNAAQASVNASYAELKQAMGKERFLNPEYISRLVQTPEQLVREQGAIKAIQLQSMNDNYKRLEEMMFVVSSDAAADMDAQLPGSAVEGAVVR